MGFEQCHPTVNLIYFAVAFYTAFSFRHPVFLIISFICAFAYSIKRNGIRSLIFNLILLPLGIAFAFYYSSYNHFGITVIDKNLIGNSITLESIVYGGLLSLKVMTSLMWLTSLYSVFTSDKVVYLFGAVSPRLSLVLSVLLRLLPRLKRQGIIINNARRGIGRGIGQGNILKRILNLFSVISILITWMIETLGQSGASMHSRGSLLRGRRAYSIYRFDSRDRAYVIAMFFCMTLVLMAVMLGQCDAVYDPMIRISMPTAVSWVFYGGYLCFAVMPMALELYTEYSFYRSRRAVKG